MKGCEYGASFDEGLHVFLFIVGGFVLPAAEQDADPFEGQGTNDGLVFFAFVSVVLHVIGGPLTLLD